MASQTAQFDSRIERGDHQIRNQNDVEITGVLTGRVRSQSDPDEWYEVDLTADPPNMCDCPDHRYREVTCKHCLAYGDYIGMFDLDT